MTRPLKPAPAHAFGKTVQSVEKFQQELQEWAEKVVPEEVRDFAVSRAFKILSAVVAGTRVAVDFGVGADIGTPVDTGRARANWQVEIGSRPSGVIEADDKQGDATIRKGQAELESERVPLFPLIFISNNLPYIRRLEEGWSSQNSGFVQRAVDAALVDDDL